MLTGFQDGIVLSRQALMSWLSRHVTKPKPKKMSSPATEVAPKEPSPGANGEGLSVCPLTSSDIMCSHEKLDPGKAGDMKVIKDVCI